MIQNHWYALTGLALAVGLAHAGAAAAVEEPALQILTPTVESSSTSTLDVSAAPAPHAVSAPTEEDASLEAMDGRGGPANVAIALTEQDLTAVNTGNTITAGVVGSGAINLQDSALSGFQGLGNVMMNTGHNNNLQSTLSVTIVVTH